MPNNKDKIIRYNAATNPDDKPTKLLENLRGLEQNFEDSQRADDDATEVESTRIYDKKKQSWMDKYKHTQYPASAFEQHVPRFSGTKNPQNSWTIWLLTFLTFEYATPIVWKGFWKPLVMTDLWELSNQDKADTVARSFEKSLAENVSLLHTILTQFGVHLLVSGILKFLADGCLLALPFFVGLIIDFISVAEPPNPNTGYYYVLLVALLYVVRLFLDGQHTYLTNLIAMRVRTALLALVFSKATKLSATSRSNRSSGEIMNLMSADAQKIGETLIYIHYTWSSVLQIIAIFVLVGYLYIGWIVALSIVVLILLIPIQLIIISLFRRWRDSGLQYTDKRISLIDEILNGIRIVKFFAWENHFKRRVDEIRNKEVRQLLKLSFLRAALSSIMNNGTIIMSIATLAVVYFYNGPGALKPDIVYPTLSYFSTMAFPLSMLPIVVIYCAESLVSINRIEDFFNLEERHELSIKAPTSDTLIDIQYGSFTWGRNDQTNINITEETEPLTGSSSSQSYGTPESKNSSFALRNINFEAKNGQLIMIIGKTGSGKSSLLHSILGEMTLCEGSIDIYGSVSFASQQPWIQNATVRDNILFGLPFDESKYNDVIAACCLTHDFEILPGGDVTEVGEKGANLSGGQKQRISLARAVYRDSDIILLDAPLSAVDPQVGKHIFNECILGFLKNRARVMTTHSLGELIHADHIVVMDHGRIVEQGSYAKLIEREGEMSRLLRDFTHEDQKREESEQIVFTDEEETDEDERADELSTAHSSISESGIQAKQPTTIIKAEEKKTGGISLKVLHAYTETMGGFPVVLLLVVTFIIAQAGIVSSDAFLTVWLEGRYPHLDKDGVPRRLIIYCALGVAAVVLVFIRELLYWLFSTLAAHRIHKRVFARVIRAPITFFDSTPIGRILSRFSKDQENVDTQLVTVLMEFYSSVCQVLACVAIIAYAIPWFLIPVVPIILVYVGVQQLYRKTARELKRLESVGRSPLYAHFHETLNGITTINTFHRQRDFIRSNRTYIDFVQRVYFIIFVAQRWLSLRLDLMEALTVVTASTMIIFFREHLPVAYAGLALSYALQITSYMSYAVLQASDAEAQMTSVERLFHYAKTIPIEKPSEVTQKLPFYWPATGRIVFFNYSLSFGPDLPAVLKNVNLEISHGEKIGIVGRTGAGKSSLILALFRMIEPLHGSVFVDGIDITSVGLADLREHMSIIPQEAVLFSGTIRSNLDPTRKYSDEKIWSALEKAHMKDFVQRLPLQLDQPVSDEATNFSIGQKQLIGLARALVKKSAILIMDEATSNIDMETDALVQRTVREEFADCTRLTIAHRLNTIIDSDRVLVMDKGRVAEFDSPRNLLMQKNSIFNNLVQETGAANANRLRSIVFSEEVSTG